MQFTNISFLFAFFPLAWLLYQFIPQRGKNLYLLCVSLLFYAFGSIRSLFILILILLWNYVCTKEVSVLRNEKKRKYLMYLTIGVDLVILGIYKYFFFWIASLGNLFGLHVTVPELTIPIGLSFYLFSTMGAFLQFYRHPEKLCSLVDYGVFAAFFGWVNLGPIAHYDQIVPQLKNHPVKKALLGQGAALFIQGFAYKVLFADNLALLYEQLLVNTSLLGSWLCGISYFLQLYFDFCGYSRMARGVAACFGFEVPENFRQPYQALSVQDYWRRWHISLTNWFRTNVYIPLGGNRVSEKLWIRNVLIVWLLTGIWHGATLSLLFWGLMQAALILLERLVLKDRLESWPRWLLHLYVLGAQVFADTFFAHPDFLDALVRLARYVGIGISSLVDAQALFLLWSNSLLLFLAFLVCSHYMDMLARMLAGRIKRQYAVLSLAGYGLVFLCSLSMLISQSAQTFLYAVF